MIEEVQKSDRIPSLLSLHYHPDERDSIIIIKIKVGDRSYSSENEIKNEFKFDIIYLNSNLLLVHGLFNKQNNKIISKVETEMKNGLFILNKILQSYDTIKTISRLFYLF